ncbi:MAG: phosphatidylserine decarboxylase [Candidatus Kapabacteria bacterium]|nr:phosphatidylserine decarboxylase [Candidatus Kapabacteria bacterium]
MILTPYGYDNAFLMLGVGICLIVLALTLGGIVLPLLAALLGILLICFTLWFFRDPERPLVADATGPGVVVAPADGQVTEVVSLAHYPALNGPATQITIFLSPVNLHVNRYPVSGIVRDVTYVPGKYLMAFNPKASEENERSIITVETATGLIEFRQITGFLARRIVYDTKRGDVVRIGERFGMMKFGSRMDIIVPASYSVDVRVGQRTRSAFTIIARPGTLTA